MNKFEIKCKEKTLKILEQKRDKHLEKTERYTNISIDELMMNGVTKKGKRILNAAIKHGKKYKQYYNIINSYTTMELDKLD